ncbi:uncharacterized protein EI97DRAFT_261006 [Westerdykella ornata]|uniref:Uncharacterized protein n=1 Tax=Westerdykella ornata TaxID=318751 RepID=A0A6A6J616_WESOR|nr:uncharacterized protein EI97DRAFT_261006 [Westerdykella ornata]KAF2271664.1 hypothetical protein EI97DRAFT_261006 [Westerdykella ornata]
MGFINSAVQSKWKLLIECLSVSFHCVLPQYPQGLRIWLLGQVAVQPVDMRCAVESSHLVIVSVPSLLFRPLTHPSVMGSLSLALRAKTENVMIS